MARPPVLVTGSHRSGTTWIGRMLCASGELGYIHEPFKPYTHEMGPGWQSDRVRRWFIDVHEENEARYREHAIDVLRWRYRVGRQVRKIRRVRNIGRIGRQWAGSVGCRLAGTAPLIKDPIAVFCAPWLARRFDVRPVVMIRHPAAFAGSLKRLDWRFDFRNWRDQPRLMRRLAPFGDAIRAACADPPDIIDQAILLWRVIYSVVDRYREDHPSWTFVRCEDVAEAPREQVRALYRELGLTWSRRVERRIAEFTGPSNVKDVPSHVPGTVRRDSRATVRTWRDRLTDEEVERVRAGTVDVSERFYQTGEWAMQGT